MTQEEIERIVQEVTQRLAAAAAEIPSDTLVVHDRLVTLATIEDRLDGIRRLQVVPRAVVTPSVRDELQRNRIELSRHAEKTTDTNEPTLFVAKLASTSGPWPLDLRCVVGEVLGSTLEEIIAAMRVKLEHSPALGAIFTAAPEQAVCLANRYKTLRAFQAISVSNVQRAMATLTANLLVLEADTSSYSARRLLDTFIGQAPRTEVP